MASKDLDRRAEVREKPLQVLCHKRDALLDDVIRPMDCEELKESGIEESGIYTVCPRGRTNEPLFPVYCDMEKDGGDWTVFERRGDYGKPANYFYKNWEDYRQGFGELNKEFWLGLDKIHSLTAQGNYMLRIKMVKFEESGDYYAVYSNFKVGSEDEDDKLMFDNFVEGNIVILKTIDSAHTIMDSGRKSAQD
ncbi:techylectin-5A-like isoform X2 [Centruroides sculpturatus]|uniref:techylectin-5A-like isoform X2 n=2 Tax=Centruroides sculpturatus TaxID=218467 RepID=UPI000C6D5ECB|nr:techylectin-5A-like isoform X2 [Centruroides sculpturatus]